MSEHNPPAGPDLRPVRHARQQFFRESGFALDGGYEAEWDEASVGPFRYRVPNPPARAAVLRRHDLHHVLTGYPATWQGEALVSAWELAAGAGPVSYAWIIALWGLFTGLVALPAETARAWFRGRGSRSFYGEALDAVDLDQPVHALQEAREVRPQGQPADRTLQQRVADGLLLVAWSLPALAVGLLSLPFTAAYVAHAMARPTLSCAWRLANTNLCSCPLQSWSAA